MSALVSWGARHNASSPFSSHFKHRINSLPCNLPSPHKPFPVPLSVKQPLSPLNVVTTSYMPHLWLMQIFTFNYKCWHVLFLLIDYQVLERDSWLILVFLHFRGLLWMFIIWMNKYSDIRGFYYIHCSSLHNQTGILVYYSLPCQLNRIVYLICPKHKPQSDIVFTSNLHTDISLCFLLLLYALQVFKTQLQIRILFINSLIGEPH